MELLNPKTVKQYQNEERSLIARRYLYSKEQVLRLIKCMCKDTISTQANIDKLKLALADFHKKDSFNDCRSMGEIVLTNIKTLIDKA